MKKSMLMLTFASIAATSGFAGLTQQNINSINSFIFQEVDNTDNPHQTYNKLLNYMNEKDLKSNIKPTITFNEMYFSTKTNTIMTSRTIKEKIGIVEMKNDNFSFDKNNWLEFAVFNENNREDLKNTLMFFNCQNLNNFGETNFVENFNGSFNGKFVIKYKINQKNCDEIYQKEKIFAQKISTLENIKSKDAIVIPKFGFFAFEEKLSSQFQNNGFLKIHTASNNQNNNNQNNNNQNNNNQNNNNQNNNNQNKTYEIQKQELVKNIEKLKEEKGLVENEIRNIKILIDKKYQLMYNSTSQDSKLSLKKDILNLKKQYEDKQISIKILENKIKIEEIKLIELKKRN